MLNDTNEQHMMINRQLRKYFKVNDYTQRMVLAWGLGNDVSLPSRGYFTYSSYRKMQKLQGVKVSNYTLLWRTTKAKTISNAGTFSKLITHRDWFRVIYKEIEYIWNLQGILGHTYTPCYEKIRKQKPRLYYKALESI